MAAVAIGAGGWGAIAGPPRTEGRTVAEARLLAAGRLLQNGDLLGASELAHRVVALSPKNGEGWALLGEVLFQRGDNVGAHRALRQATELKSEDFRSFLLLGKTSRRLGLEEEARAAFTRARELDPSNPDAALESARLAEEDGDLQKAIDLYAGAAKALSDPRQADQRPGDERRADVLARMATLEQRRGEHDAAAEALKAAAEAQPERPTRWARAARAFERAGDRAEAEEAWRATESLHR